MSASVVEFNEGQLEGMRKILEWYKGWLDGHHNNQIFFLTGFAGTGKTSLARAAADCCTRSVAFIAPTGKAASRLRQKGCPDAKTMHNLVYRPVGEDDEGKPIFEQKEIKEDEFPDLIVLDEASMVNEYDMNTITKHGIPVLALGDLGQIPPVNGKQALTDADVNHNLIEILRQEAESNIIRASIYARNGQWPLPSREYKDVKVVRGKRPNIEELINHCDDDSQIICSYNRTRADVTQEIREYFGYKQILPQPGEKVMCWYNQHDFDFMNGEQGILLHFEDIWTYRKGQGRKQVSFADVQAYNPGRMVDSVGEEKQRYEIGDTFIAVLRSLTTGKEQRVIFNPDSFNRDEDISKAAKKGAGGFDFGYVCTVHKAQGSEWKRVLLIDQPMRGNIEKMAYTAVTRASEHLTIYSR